MLKNLFSLPKIVDLHNWADIGRYRGRERGRGRPWSSPWSRLERCLGGVLLRVRGARMKKAWPPSNPIGHICSRGITLAGSHLPLSTHFESWKICHKSTIFLPQPKGKYWWNGPKAPKKNKIHHLQISLPTWSGPYNICINIIT